MAVVPMHSAVSVDGFIADENDQVGPLFDYYGNGDVEIVPGGQIKVSQASADYLREMWAGIGAMVIGRRLFDLTNGGPDQREVSQDSTALAIRARSVVHACRSW